MKRAHSRGEGGYTLTEVLVAVSILTTSIVVIVGAMSAGIIGSRVHRDVVTSDSIVRSYADQIIAASYTPCTSSAPATYPAMAAATLPAGYSATITQIQYWNGATPATFGACPTTDLGLQQITITAQRTTGASGGGGVQTLQILKRAS